MVIISECVQLVFSTEPNMNNMGQYMKELAVETNTRLMDGQTDRWVNGIVYDIPVSKKDKRKRKKIVEFISPPICYFRETCKSQNITPIYLDP